MNKNPGYSQSKNKLKITQIIMCLMCLTNLHEDTLYYYVDKETIIVNQF